jgi:hypothetical protein
MYDGSVTITMYCARCSNKYFCTGDQRTVNAVMRLHERGWHGITNYSNYKVDHNSKQFSTSYNNNTLSSRVVTQGNKRISVENIDGKIPSNFELDAAIARSVPKVGSTNGESSSASFTSNNVAGGSSGSKHKKNKKKK